MAGFRTDVKILVDTNFPNKVYCHSMNYSVAIFARALLVAILSFTLLGANSVAGPISGADACDMPCCQPQAHRTAHAGNIRISSATSMACCGSANSYPCDLKTQRAPRQPYLCHAIQSNFLSGPAVISAGQTLKMPPRLIGSTGRFCETDPVAVRSIYIEIQSILI